MRRDRFEVLRNILDHIASQPESEEAIGALSLCSACPCNAVEAVDEDNQAIEGLDFYDKDWNRGMRVVLRPHGCFTIQRFLKDGEKWSESVDCLTSGKIGLWQIHLHLLWVLDKPVDVTDLDTHGVW